MKSGHLERLFTSMISTKASDSETTKEITERDVYDIENRLRERGFSEDEIIKMWLIDNGAFIFRALTYGHKRKEIEKLKEELKGKT